MPVASFCASETAETGRIANGREQGDHVSRRQESFKGGIAAEKEAAERQKVVAVATGHRRRRKSFLPYFLYFTKSRKKKSPQGGGETAERQKDLIGIARRCCLGELIRGLQNLEACLKRI